LLGAFLYELIQLIPIVGWIFLFGLFLASLGALAVFDFEHWWPRYGRRGDMEEAPKEAPEEAPKEAP